MRQHETRMGLLIRATRSKMVSPNGPLFWSRFLSRRFLVLLLFAFLSHRRHLLSPWATQEAGETIHPAKIEY